MNIFKRLLIATFVLGIVFSCEDEAGQPYQIEDILVDQGAFIRLQSVNAGEFDLSNFASSNMNVDLEHWDVEDGALLQDAVLTIQFIDNTPADVVTRDIVTYATYTADQWTADPDTGLPNITINVSAQEALAALNLTTDDIDGGDTFRFEWTLNLTNGKSFNRNNSSSSLPSWPFYNAPFLLDVNVICSVPDGYAIGSYTLTQNSGGLFGGTFDSGDIVVELVEGATSTQRTFDAEYLAQFGIGQGPNTFAFNLVCERAIFVNEQPTGLGCADGALIIGAADTPGAYDPADDSSIDIMLKENTGSACGGGPVDVSFTLTRN